MKRDWSWYKLGCVQASSGYFIGFVWYSKQPSRAKNQLAVLEERDWHCSNHLFQIKVIICKNMFGKHWNSMPVQVWKWVQNLDIIDIYFNLCNCAISHHRSWRKKSKARDLSGPFRAVHYHSPRNLFRASHHLIFPKLSRKKGRKIHWELPPKR